MRSRFIKPISLAVVVLFAAGCANTSSIEDASNTASSAQKSADSANSTASQALQAARDAQRTADEAKRIAEEALQVANQAKASSLEANTKIDRSFKKAMAK